MFDKCQRVEAVAEGGRPRGAVGEVKDHPKCGRSVTRPRPGRNRRANGQRFRTMMKGKKTLHGGHHPQQVPPSGTFGVGGGEGRAGRAAWRPGGSGRL